MVEQNGKTKYDWEALRQEFFTSDILEAKAFIRQRLGIEPEKDGNVCRHIAGWAEEKKAFQRKVFQEAQDKLSKEEIEKLTVKLTDVLAGKRIGFSLLIKYLQCYARSIQEAPEVPLTEKEQDFMKKFPIDIDKALKWLQIELGLPINIAELQGAKDKPLILIDIMRLAEKAKKDDNTTGSEDTSK